MSQQQFVNHEYISRLASRMCRSSKKQEQLKKLWYQEYIKVCLEQWQQDRFWVLLDTYPIGRVSYMIKENRMG